MVENIENAICLAWEEWSNESRCEAGNQFISEKENFSIPFVRMNAKLTYTMTFNSFWQLVEIWEILTTFWKIQRCKVNEIASNETYFDLKLHTPKPEQPRWIFGVAGILNRAYILYNISSLFEFVYNQSVVFRQLYLTVS